MDSFVTLFWISSPGKSWKVFVGNRVRKIASITTKVGIEWKYCPTKENVADLRSRGARINRIESREWFTGPEWLLNEDRWLESTKDAYQESSPFKENVHYVKENQPDEWDSLLDRNTYWKTFLVTPWALRFSNNSLAKKRKLEKKRGPMDTDEIDTANNCWIRRVQSKTPEKVDTLGLATRSTYNNRDV